MDVDSSGLDSLPTLRVGADLRFEGAKNYRKSKSLTWDACTFASDILPTLAQELEQLGRDQNSNNGLTSSPALPPHRRSSISSPSAFSLSSGLGNGVDIIEPSPLSLPSSSNAAVGPDVASPSLNPANASPLNPTDPESPKEMDAMAYKLGPIPIAPNSAPYMRSRSKVKSFGAPGDALFMEPISEDTFGSNGSSNVRETVRPPHKRRVTFGGLEEFSSQAFASGIDQFSLSDSFGGVDWGSPVKNTNNSADSTANASASASPSTANSSSSAKLFPETLFNKAVTANNPAASANGQTNGSPPSSASSSSSNSSDTPLDTIAGNLPGDLPPKLVDPSPLASVHATPGGGAYSGPPGGGFPPQQHHATTNNWDYSNHQQSNQGWLPPQPLDKVGGFGTQETGAAGSPLPPPGMYGNAGFPGSMGLGSPPPGPNAGAFGSPYGGPQMNMMPPPPPIMGLPGSDTSQFQQQQQQMYMQQMAQYFYMQQQYMNQQQRMHQPPHQHSSKPPRHGNPGGKRNQNYKSSSNNNAPANPSSYHDSPRRGGQNNQQFGRISTPQRGSRKRFQNSHGGGQGKGRSHSGNFDSLPANTCAALVEYKTSGRRPTMEELTGHVVEFSRDAHGSRFIQFKMEIAPEVEKQQLIEEVLDEAVSLMQDTFGNYVIQNFLEHGSKAQRNLLSNTMLGSMYALSAQAHGCRVVQRAFDLLDTQQRNKLLAELLLPPGNVSKCARNSHATHVFQKAVNILINENRVSDPAKLEEAKATFPDAPSSHNLLAAVEMAVHESLLTLAVHPHAYRLVLHVMGNCDPAISSWVAEMMVTVENNQMPLAVDQHGNFILQHILDVGSSDQAGKVQTFVMEHVLELSQHKFGSHLVEKCLACATPSQVHLLIKQLMAPTGANKEYAEKVMTNSTNYHKGGKGNAAVVAQASAEASNYPLLMLMQDPYANFVVQKAFDKSTGNQRQQLVDEILSRADLLSKFTYGRHILSHINREQQAAK